VMMMMAVIFRRVRVCAFNAYGTCEFHQSRDNILACEHRNLNESN
jgi:hypothetical protein